MDFVEAVAEAARTETAPTRAKPIFCCLYHDGQGPAFNGGWYKAIHDFPGDPIHGNVDFTDALRVSCNVYFGQLGLKLGPEGLKSLRDAGVEFGWGGSNWDPGKKGSRDLASTAFGQAASLMSVSQGARIAATVGAGGVYRRCPPSLDLNEDPPAADFPDPTYRFGSTHPGGFNMMMCDGSVKFLSENISMKTYNAAGSRAGGEVLSLE